MTVEQVVDTTGLSEGRCVDRPGFVDVEVGAQGGDRAVEQAERCVRSFLAAVGAIRTDAAPVPTAARTDYYEVTEIAEKRPDSEYEFLARNFERVEAGETYARRDGEALVADEPFTPVLASGDGHDTILGYRARLVGEL
jgi:predicted deacylase